MPDINEYNGLQWEEIPGGIRILKYTGEYAAVEIPDEIKGEKVIKVARYAFSAMPFLHEVVIGRYVTEIDKHAFYDSRNLERVELWDHVRSMGDGAFRNCEKLRRILLHVENGRDSCIRDILSECQQEIIAEIDYQPMDAASSERTSMTAGSGAMAISDHKAFWLFPEFGIEYFENAFTRTSMFREETYGSGEAYRQCLQGTSMDIRAYDALFGRSGREDRGPAAAGIALLRLRYPRGLTDSAKADYRNWLKEHATDGVRWILENGEDSFLAFMKQEGLFDEKNLPDCMKAAEEAGDPAVTAGLLTISLELRYAAGGTDAAERYPMSDRMDPAERYSIPGKADPAERYSIPGKAETAERYSIPGRTEPTEGDPVPGKTDPAEENPLPDRTDPAGIGEKTGFGSRRRRYEL